MLLRMHQLNQAMSQRFGTKVWLLNSPTLRDDRFEEWCDRHGVDPSFDRTSDTRPIP
jgi:hypothetical protein